MGIVSNREKMGQRDKAKKKVVQFREDDPTKLTNI